MKPSRLVKMNLKKAFIIYLVAAVVAGIGSAVVLGVVFRDMISLMMEYRNVSDIGGNGISLVDQRGKLAAFAASSDKVVDVLILDQDNTITFTAKNSAIANNGTLDLVPAPTADSYPLEKKRYDGHEMNYVYLADPAALGTYYRILDTSFPGTLKTLVAGWSARDDFEEAHFYERGVKTVYSLRYIADAETGDKVYIIFDIKPVLNSGYLIKGVASLAMLFFMIYWVLVALAVYVDASKSKLRGAAWGLLTLFTNLAGALIYLIYKQVNRTCHQCHAVQGKDNTYCTSCGAKLEEACSKCGSGISRYDDYCGHCGEKTKGGQ